MFNDEDKITPVTTVSSVPGPSSAPAQDSKATDNAANVPAPALSPILEQQRDAAAGVSSPGEPSDVGGVLSGSSSEPMSSSIQIFNPADPMNFGRHRRDNISRAQMKIDHPTAASRKHRALKKYYTRQNEMIDQFLGAGDEERAKVEEDVRLGPRIKFAVVASFSVNLCLFIIQMYAAISTGSLSVRASIFFCSVGRLGLCWLP